MTIQSIKMQNGALGTIPPVRINQRTALLADIWRGSESVNTHSHLREGDVFL